MSSPLRELDQRSADGIDVRMLWHSSEDRVVVRVSDARTGDAFSLDVAPHERAYDVFHHPYAFAADPRRRAGLTVAAA